MNEQKGNFSIIMEKIVVYDMMCCELAQGCLHIFLGKSTVLDT